MTAMARPRHMREHVLLDPEVWDAPFSLSADDLSAPAGAARRPGGHPVDDPEDER